ncbi:unnamed protein product [Calypogeia fissa]
MVAVIIRDGGCPAIFILARQRHKKESWAVSNIDLEYLVLIIPATPVVMVLSRLSYRGGSRQSQRLLL